MGLTHSFSTDYGQRTTDKKKPGAFRPRVMQFNRVVILQAESSEAARSFPPAAWVIEIRVIRLIPKG
jgi:hypothetical protein